MKSMIGGEAKAGLGDFLSALAFVAFGASAAWSLSGLLRGDFEVYFGSYAPPYLYSCL